MNHRALARIALLIALLAISLPARAARSQAGISLTASAAFDGNYVPGAWLPISASIENAGPAADVIVSAELPGATARQALPLELAGGAQKQVVLYVAMDQSVREMRVAVERDGAAIAEQTIALRPRVDERMLGLLSGAELSLALPRREDLTSQPFTAVQLTAADMPAEAVGLSSLSILLVQGLPPESLSAAQLDALLAWVQAGGHLVIGAGDAAAINGWLPDQLIAATPGGDASIDADPLAALAAAPGPGALQGVRLAPLPGGVAAGPAEAPAWVSRSFGHGLVTQLAFDPGAPELSRWAAAPSFWSALLQPALLVGTPFGTQSSVDFVQEQLLAGALTALPSIPQPPVNLFFVLLVIYTLAIGPLLALFLRRIDRQSWSWLLVPVISISSGLLLLTLAIGMRTSDQIVNQISLVEDLGDGQTRTRTLVGALSPQGQSFSTQVPAGAITRPLREIAGLYGTISGVSGDLLQQSNQITLSVEPWRLQGILLEQQLPIEGLASAITISDQGVQIEVTNRGNQILRDVAAIYGSRVLLLGDVRPGEQLNGRWAANQPLVSTSDDIIGQIFADEVAAANRPGQAANRRTEIQVAMASAALYGADTSAAAGPLVLAWIDRSPLEAQVDAPRAAQQSLTLLTTRPQVQASGTIGLPEGWLALDPALSQRSTCTSDSQTGVRANPAPATLAMRLPDALSPLQADMLTLTLDSSERWPSAGVTVEIYDWGQSKWVNLPFDGPGDLEVPSPRPYLAEGRIQVRLSGSIERAGCIFATARVQGTMP